MLVVVGALCTGMHSPGPIYDPPSDFKPRPSTAGARVPKTRPDRFANGYVRRSASPGPIYQLPSFASQAKPISFGSGPRFPPHSASLGCCYEAGACQASRGVCCVSGRSRWWPHHYQACFSHANCLSERTTASTHLAPSTSRTLTSGARRPSPNPNTFRQLVRSRPAPTTRVVRAGPWCRRR